MAGALIGALLAGGGAAGPAPDDKLLNPLASAKTREEVRAKLAGLQRQVWLRVFTQARDDEQTTAAARRLAQGVADLSDSVFAEAYSYDEDADRFREYGIERTPAIAVTGEADRGIRFYGVPGGHELESLVSAICVVAAQDSGLSAASRQALAGLAGPVRIEVFVTLACGFCPEAVTLAHRLAVESPQVTAAMVEVSAFPEYAQQRAVRSVPKVFVNGQPCFEGRRGEDEFVAAVVGAAAKSRP